MKHELLLELNTTNTILFEGRFGLWSNYVVSNSMKFEIGI